VFRNVFANTASSVVILAAPTISNTKTASVINCIAGKKYFDLNNLLIITV
jgi:hypothetical protein